MIKPIATLDDILHRGDWCGQLQQARYEHIPLSEKMGVRIQQYTGQKFITTMPETGNQNPHHTLFAGSLFSLATLTGWGLIWLMLRERHLGGTITRPTRISDTAGRSPGNQLLLPIWGR